MDALGHGLPLPLNRQSLDLATGPLVNFGGASAAYSLRDLNGQNPMVVRVRRESDNNERDFNQDTINSGDMVRWVNEQITPPLDLRELTATGRDGPIIEAAAAYSLRNLSADGTSLTSAGDTQTDYFVFTGATGDTAALNGIKYVYGFPYNGAKAYNSAPPAPENTQMVRGTSGNWTLFDATPNPSKTYANSATNVSTEYPWEADWTGTDLENATFSQQRTGSLVTQVRRSSDGSTQSFTAAEVADGTLEAWVNTSFANALPLDTASGAAAAYSLRSLGTNQWSYAGDTVTYTSDFSAGIDGFGSILGTIEGNIDGIGNQDDNLRFTIDSSAGQHGLFIGSWTSGLTYRITFDFYIPSSNTDIDGVYASLRDGNSSVLSVTDEWTTFSHTGTPLSNGVFYINAAKGGSASFTGNGTDVFYVRNIVITETLGDTEVLPAGKYVTQVRRSSDDAVKSFTAAEVSDGTLEAWVNTDVDKLDLGVPPSGGLSGNYTSGADSADFSISNEGSTGYGFLLDNADVTAGSYAITFDVNLNSGSLEGVTVVINDPSNYQYQSLVSGSNSFSGTISNTGQIFFRTSGTAVADVSITNITLTQTSANGHVSKWYDQSGNDKHATQGTPASQPKIVDAGALVTGGLDFDGVDDLLETSLVPPNVATLIGVANWDTINNFMAIIGARDSASNRSYIAQVSSGRTALGVADSALSGPKVVAGDDYLLFGTYSGSTRLLSTNGSVVSDSSGSAPNNTTYGYNIGANNTAGVVSGYIEGTLAEVIVYPSDETANRLAIEANINNQYDIY